MPLVHAGDTSKDLILNAELNHMPTHHANQGERALRRVLMIAFHFPPLAGSSGIQRTLRFVQHLPTLGWQPIVLTAQARAYEATSEDLVPEIPAGTIVERAFALDAARHLSIGGHYPGFLGRPDRWRPWAHAAVRSGLSLIKKYRPDVLWSTYPIATAHLIANRLHQLSGLPLVADFRDPMAQHGYPTDERTRRSFLEIERSLAQNAARLVFVTLGAQALYRDRYATVDPERFVLIENGYDEDSFAAAESGLDEAPLNAGRFTLLHTGIVYPHDRDPSALFAAVGRLRIAGHLSADTLKIRFRAPVHVELLRRLSARYGIADLIEVLPGISYRQALEEMLRADGVMVLQGAECNEQIPVKLYEYFRAGRPILGLADPEGETGRTMRLNGVVHVARLEDTQQVEATLIAYLSASRAGRHRVSPSAQISAMSRRSQAAALAALLESVCSAAVLNRA